MSQGAAKMQRDPTPMMTFRVASISNWFTVGFRMAPAPQMGSTVTPTMSSCGLVEIYPSSSLRITEKVTISDRSCRLWDVPLATPITKSDLAFR